jgi:hypothetical protein
VGEPERAKQRTAESGGQVLIHYGRDEVRLQPGDGIRCEAQQP